jgi:acyl carrier protein
MEIQSIVRELRKEVRKVRLDAPEDLATGSHFVDDCGFDSMDLVEFVARIEQDFGILIPDGDLPGLTSLDATARYIRMRLTQ